MLDLTNCWLTIALLEKDDILAVSRVKVLIDYLTNCDPSVERAVYNDEEVARKLDRLWNRGFYIYNKFENYQDQIRLHYSTLSTELKDMVTIQHIPTSYKKGVELLKNRDVVKVNKNGRIFKGYALGKYPSICVQLHNTVIVEFFNVNFGSFVRLNTGGWSTRTTKRWMNKAVWKYQISVHSVGGVWEVTRLRTDRVVVRQPFEDGMILELPNIFDQVENE